MLSRLSFLRKGKGREQEEPPSTPRSPFSLPSPIDSIYNMDSATIFASFASDAAPPQEQDSAYALALSQHEERMKQLQLDADANLAAELWEQDELEQRRRDQSGDELLLRMLEEEEKEEERKKAKDEQWFEGEKVKFEEAELRKRGVYCCETCEGEFYEATEMVQCSECHLLCLDCASSGVKVRFEELDASLRCLVDFGTCEGNYTAHEMRKFLEPQQLVQWSKLRLRSDLEGVEGLTTCPKCDYAVVLDDPAHLIETFECMSPSCKEKTCLKCKTPAHPGKSCLQANPPAAIHALEESMSATLIHACPKCKKPFIKEDGCNMITCSCRTKSCYICRAEVKDYGHWDKAGPCKGKIYDKTFVTNAVEQVRQDGMRNLSNDEERRHVASL
ncbi:hypothetical protein RQP46_003161 [Phenoliferia psychrophenolica]